MLVMSEAHTVLVVPPVVVVVRGEGEEGVWPEEGEEGGDWVFGERVTDRSADSCRKNGIHNIMAGCRCDTATDP